MVFCTINDYPAYGNLSGYSVKGHHTCPICEKNTRFLQFKHGKKTIYTRHRRFLKHYHPYRWLKKDFNGSQENQSAPKPLDGKEVYDRVKPKTLVHVYVSSTIAGITSFSTFGEHRVSRSRSNCDKFYLSINIVRKFRNLNEKKNRRNHIILLGVV